MTMPVPWAWGQGIGLIAPTGLVGRMAGLIVAYLLLTLAQRALSRNLLLRSLGLQINLLVLALLVLLFLNPVLGQMSPNVTNAVMAATVFLGIAVILKLVDVLCFDLLARWRNKPQVPLVVRDLGRLAIAAIALVLVVRQFFPGVNLNVLAVSSLVVGYIVGNATQDTLGNLIAGLALNAERPFQIGDWVTVGGHTGQIVDTTWRATRLRTKTEDYIVIPNASIAREAILNFSRPTRSHGCTFPIGVSYETPPNRAREVILGVLAEAPDVCATPPPSVVLSGYGDFAITFSVKFFLTDFSRQDAILSGVMDRLWYAFRREGISIPFPVQDSRQRDMVADERAERAATREAIRQLLAGVELLQVLSPEEREALVERVRLQVYGRGEHLCKQGEAGDSFYVIRSGCVGVWVSGANAVASSVARLGPGHFFGEMSLLTGAPRSGTVTAETDVEVVRVSKEDFAGLVKGNTVLADRLASVLEARLAARGEKIAELAQSGAAVPARSALAARIRHFFRLEKK